MRPFLPLVLLAGCGRIAFDAAPPDGAPGIDAVPGSYAAEVLASDPRVYFRLDESSEGVIRDSSGHGNDGSVFVTAGSTLTPLEPGALSTDSDVAMRIIGDGNAGPGGDCAVVLDAQAVDWSGDFTVELFLQQHTVPPMFYNDTVFICEEYLVSGFRMGWTPMATLRAWVDQGGGNAVLDSTQVTEYGRFVHAVLVHTGSSFVLYRDGVELGRQVVDYVPVTAIAQCGFGAFHGSPSDATYDELALYDRALDPDEILRHVSAR